MEGENSKTKNEDSIAEAACPVQGDWLSQCSRWIPKNQQSHQETVGVKTRAKRTKKTQRKNHQEQAETNELPANARGGG